MGIPKRRKNKIRSKKTTKRNAKVRTWSGPSVIEQYYQDDQIRKFLNAAQVALVNDRYWVSSTASSGTTIVWTNYSRRVTWQDVLKDWGIFEVSLKWTRKFFLTALITMKDFLLIRSRLFSANSGSTTGNFNDSTSGCSDKPVPSSNVIIEPQGKSSKRAGYTSTTFSAGSKTKRKGRRSSSTKFNIATKTPTRPVELGGVKKFRKFKLGKGAYGVK